MRLSDADLYRQDAERAYNALWSIRHAIERATYKDDLANLCNADLRNLVLKVNELTNNAL